MLGLFQELGECHTPKLYSALGNVSHALPPAGPCRINNDSTAVDLNPESYTEFANV